MAPFKQLLSKNVCSLSLFCIVNSFALLAIYSTVSIVIIYFTVCKQIRRFDQRIFNFPLSDFPFFCIQNAKFSVRCHCLFADKFCEYEQLPTSTLLLYATYKFNWHIRHEISYFKYQIKFSMEHFTCETLLKNSFSISNWTEPRIKTNPN